MYNEKQPIPMADTKESPELMTLINNIDSAVVNTGELASIILQKLSSIHATPEQLVKHFEDINARKNPDTNGGCFTQQLHAKINRLRQHNEFLSMAVEHLKIITG